MKFDHFPRQYHMDQLTETRINDKRHYITPKGDVYPSVTTILSMLPNPSLDAWREAVGTEEADRQSRITITRGEKLHNVIEHYLDNEDDYLTGAMPDMKAMFKGVQPLLDNIDAIFCLEQQLYSDKYKFAGRCDVIGKYKMARYHRSLHSAVIDFKTHGSDLNFSGDKIGKYFLQCAAYAIAFEEYSGATISEGVLIFGSNDFGASEHEADLYMYKEKFLDIVSDYHKKVSA